MTLNQTRED